MQPNQGSKAQPHSRAVTCLGNIIQATKQLHGSCYTENCSESQRSQVFGQHKRDSAFLRMSHRQSWRAVVVARLQRCAQQGLLDCAQPPLVRALPGARQDARPITYFLHKRSTLVSPQKKLTHAHTKLPQGSELLFREAHRLDSPGSQVCAGYLRRLALTNVPAAAYTGSIPGDCVLCNPISHSINSQSFISNLHSLR
jgi:hypothetical protein